MHDWNIFALMKIICIILFCAAILFSYFVIFEKAGEAGWKVFIPVYNIYTAFKIAWSPYAFWIFFGDYFIIAISFIFFREKLAAKIIIILLLSLLVILYILYTYSLADAFDKDPQFALGLGATPFLFLLILAFGDAEYQYQWVDSSGEQYGTELSGNSAQGNDVLESGDSEPLE